MKKFLLIALLFVSVLSASACGAPKSQVTASQPSPEAAIEQTRIPTEATPTSAPAPLPTAEVVVIYPKFNLETGDKPNYLIRAYYPFMTSSNPNAQKFNNETEQRMKIVIDSYKKDFGEENPNLPPEIAIRQSTLDINHSIPYADNRIISVLFTIDSYIAGAAHPNHIVQSLNFDLNQGRVLQLADLFTKDSDFLDILSRYCIDDLKQREFVKDDEKWITEGAGAKDLNYAIWNVTAEGLQITFDTYQVAPYVAGPQTVIVPYAEVKAIINPDFQISQSSH